MDKKTEFGIALSEKDYAKALDIACSFWYGSPQKRAQVLYKMLADLLIKEKIE